MARGSVVRDENGRVELTPSGKPVVHGRASSYNNQGCRCDECKEAWAKYMHPRLKKWRKDKKTTKATVHIKL